jgi:hypothetical protein
MQWLETHINLMVDRFVWLSKIDRDYAIHALRDYKKRCCNDDEPWQKLIEAKELDRLIKERMNETSRQG